MAGIG